MVLERRHAGHSAVAPPVSRPPSRPWWRPPNTVCEGCPEGARVRRPGALFLRGRLYGVLWPPPPPSSPPPSSSPPSCCPGSASTAFRTVPNGTRVPGPGCVLSIVGTLILPLATSWAICIDRPSSLAHVAAPAQTFRRGLER